MLSWRHPHVAELQAGLDSRLNGEFMISWCPSLTGPNLFLVPHIPADVALTVQAVINAPFYYVWRFTNPNSNAEGTWEVEWCTYYGPPELVPQGTPLVTVMQVPAKKGLYMRMRMHSPTQAEIVQTMNRVRNMAHPIQPLPNTGQPPPTGGGGQHSGLHGGMTAGRGSGRGSGMMRGSEGTGLGFIGQANLYDRRIMQGGGNSSGQGQGLGQQRGTSFAGMTGMGGGRGPPPQAGRGGNMIAGRGGGDNMRQSGDRKGLGGGQVPQTRRGLGADTGNNTDGGAMMGNHGGGLGQQYGHTGRQLPAGAQGGRGGTSGDTGNPQRMKAQEDAQRKRSGGPSNAGRGKFRSLDSLEGTGEAEMLG